MEKQIYKFLYKYIDYQDFFLNWGCYIFAKILQKKFWWEIYSNCDHCMCKIWIVFWDIRGKHLWKWYNPIDKLEEQRYINYENF